MLLRRCLLGQTELWRKYLKTDVLANKIVSWNSYTIAGCPLVQRYHSFNPLRTNENGYLNTTFIHQSHRKHYSKGLLDGDVSTIVDNIQEQELKKIIELFPQPRVTLNELTSRTPQKIFDIHFKQLSSVPKGAKKAKKLVQNDWVATYSFIWPEKMKFECASKSKRQAAEKAATQALLWLYQNKRIDNKGQPIYDKNVLDEIRSTLNEPIHVTISDNTMERIDRIWDDYQEGIKDIYEAAAENASHFVARSPAAFTKDSTVDEDPEYLKEESEPDEIADISDLKTRIHPVYGRHITAPSENTLLRRDRMLKQRFQQYDEELTPLPIDNYRNQITSAIDNARVTVIVGAAGCGKSTRVPAAILRHCGAKTNMVVSEPRRVAAIGLAERVASEMGEQVGDSIGYHVRLQAKPPRPPAGSVLYCTSGVLLRRLQANPGLEGCSHVIIDEAHERDVNTDITLLLLKRALNINPELKVIIMSATLDTQVFTRYFDSCPVIEVPGRTYPVEVSYLDDIQKKYNLPLRKCFENCSKEDGKPNLYCDEIVEVIKAVDKNESEGAILVFLPGWAEIKTTKQILDEYYGESSMHMILPVHSRLSTTEQTKMFSTPSPGIRKIVLATNVAETSITIPDVVYVIDSGAHKENNIKEATGTASLHTVWVPASGARQRTGRAGRVQPGHCYRLYTKEKESEFVPHSTPEILRIPLEQTVLDCKTYAPDEKVQSFFSELPEPPSEKATQFAVNDLIDLGALSPTEKLTKLGSVLSSLTLHPRVGFCMLTAGVSGGVSSAAAVAAHCQDYVELFRNATDRREATILGSILSSLTLHPRVGFCMLTAGVSGGVSSAAAVAAHCQDYVELFRNATDRREEIREIKRKYSDTSDHCALSWIQDEFEQVVQEKGWQGCEQWCDKYGLRRDRLGHIQSLSNLYLEQLVRSGFLGPAPDAQELNRFSGVDELTTAALLAGVNSLMLTRTHVRTKGKLKTAVEVTTSKGERAHIGTESVNYGITKRINKTHLLTYFGGFHSTERRALVLSKTSVVPPHTALLFCRGDLKKICEVEDDEQKTILSLPRHRLKVYVPNNQADYIMKTKEMLWSTIQYHIDRNTNDLDYEETTKVTRFKVRLFKAIGRMLVEADKEYVQRKVEGNR